MNIKNKIFGLYIRIKRMASYYYNISFHPFWREKRLKPKVLGNKYGRGYFIPGLLKDDNLVYSFGIGEDISFDLGLIKEYKSTIVGFDPTPKSIQWVKDNHEIPKSFSFMEYGLAKDSGSKRFYLPADSTQVSASLTKNLGGGHIDCDFLSFEDVLNKLGHTYVDLAKIDIEGEEYNLFQDWLNRGYTPPIGQIWVEFHPERAGYTNFSTNQFVRKLKKISLEPARSALVKRTNHYLLVNTKYS